MRNISRWSDEGQSQSPPQGGEDEPARDGSHPQLPGLASENRISEGGKLVVTR